MPGRKVPLITGRYYHVLSRSIAGYKIFRAKRDYVRMIELLKFYQILDPPFRYSHLERLEDRDAIFERLRKQGKRLVDIIAYCLMPTHIHLILKQRLANGISTFMSNALNSYTCYFNRRFKRKGPLWAGRFKNVEIESNEQLLHLTRYIHLNPVSAYLVDRPEDWEFSSYNEFVEMMNKDRICEYRQILDIKGKKYRKFVMSQKRYQRELAKIKSLCLD